MSLCICVGSKRLLNWRSIYNLLIFLTAPPSKIKKIPKYYTCFIVLFFSNIFYSCTLHLMLAQRWQGYDFFLLGYARSCNFIMTGTICFLPLFTLEDVAGINPRNMSLPSFLCFSSSCFSIHFYSAMFFLMSSS